ncbi:hypothetical protein DITRI_Ditri14bG0037900 [Diplodiscus trichospermus]
MIASTCAPESRTQQPRQEHVPHFEGTANRRIKLRRPEAEILCDTGSGRAVGESSSKKLSSPKSEESPKRLLSLFSPKEANLHLVYATF